MLSCREISYLVSESLDQKLPIRKRMAVRLHLWMCKLCSRYKMHLFFLRTISRHPQMKNMETSAGPSLPPEARERIKRFMDKK